MVVFYLVRALFLANKKKCHFLTEPSIGRENERANSVMSPLQFSSVQSLSHVRLFATPWITARQASLSITSSRSSLRLTFIKSVMPSSHLILCRPLLLLPPIPPSIRVFSNELTLRMRWSKYWSFSFSISPSKEHPGLISFRMGWLDLLAVQGTLKSLLQLSSYKGTNLILRTPSSWSHLNLITSHRLRLQILEVSTLLDEFWKNTVQSAVGTLCYPWKALMARW